MASKGWEVSHPAERRPRAQLLLSGFSPDNIASRPVDSHPMGKAIKGLLASKKFFVFLTGVLGNILVVFAGLPEEQAADLADKITNLAMTFMGAQGVADVGVYLGEALAAKRAPEPAVEPAVEPESVPESDVPTPPTVG